MQQPTRRTLAAFASILVLIGPGGCTTTTETPAATVADDLPRYIREHYTKREHRIPMRDGVRLFTAVYMPRDTSRPKPIMLLRTPYSVSPYGEDAYRGDLGPNPSFAREGYIFVYQDVRGRYMSEGEFVNMRPHVANKRGPTDIDESSDTYDTIQWLLENVPDHNGRVGTWGISYPGFYAAAGMIGAHPALRAVSPQAPVSDWYFDDFHHHGAFFLPHAFNFFASFGRPRPEPTTDGHGRFDHGTPDGYRFFLDLGPLKNANERHFKDEIAFWNDIVDHPDYDAFWQARNILPHLHDTAPAVMTVGGWYDAEDLYGPLKIYQAVERNDPDAFNVLVMGPWRHGGWKRDEGDRMGNIHFGSKTSAFYQQQVESVFFRTLLKGTGLPEVAEATVFDTGRHAWTTFNRWPPAGVETRRLYCREGLELSFDAPDAAGDGFDQFASDPENPVPFTEVIARGMTREYMTADQRFAARRPDVLAYRSPVLKTDLTVAGPIIADLRVSTSGTASDWVVKVIDVLPPDTPDHDDLPVGRHLGGYQMMVRSEVIRGRYRNSYEHPEPFVPDEPTRVSFELQDVLHTFKAGHRIMVQIQSTWFPLVDRNPHRYVDNVFEADESDFIKATQRVYRTPSQPTSISLGVLPPAGTSELRLAAEPMYP